MNLPYGFYSVGNPFGFPLLGFPRQRTAVIALTASKCYPSPAFGPTMGRAVKRLGQVSMCFRTWSSLRVKPWTPQGQGGESGRENYYGDFQEVARDNAPGPRNGGPPLYPFVEHPFLAH